MGYRLHHTIIISGFDSEEIEESHSLAINVFGELVSPIIDTKMNSVKSFFISPDGSKEGLETSDEFDLKRLDYIKFLKTELSMTEFVEVAFGAEDGKKSVVIEDSNWLNRV
ncbi:MAG: hypothetical protein COA88_12915 [Kordia sp.]|nr:MAG: hypothetical protein COA88_12915 [Kordia sp.]